MNIQIYKHLKFYSFAGYALKSPKLHQRQKSCSNKNEKRQEKRKSFRQHWTKQDPVQVTRAQCPTFFYSLKHCEIQVVKRAPKANHPQELHIRL